MIFFYVLVNLLNVISNGICLGRLSISKSVVKDYTKLNPKTILNKMLYYL